MSKPIIKNKAKYTRFIKIKNNIKPKQSNFLLTIYTN